MKRLFLIAGAACALALAGCANKVELPAGQALLVAEAATDGANHAATIAANGGVFNGHPETARQVHAGVRAANAAVDGAYAFYRKGDIPGAIGQLNVAFKNIADVKAKSPAPATSPAVQP